LYLERARSLRGLHAVLDAACIVVAFGVAYVVRGVHDDLPLLSSVPSIPWNPSEHNPSDYALLLAVSLVTWIWGLRSRGGYLAPHRGGLAQMLVAQTRGLVWAVLGAGAAVFAVKLATVSRLYFGYYYAIGLLLLVIKDLAMRATVRRLARSRAFQRHTLLIGHGQPASWLAQVVSNAAESGHTPVGIIWNDANPPDEIGGLPVLGTLDALDDVLRDHRVDEVFVVGGAIQLAALAPVVQTLIERGRVVSVMPTLQAGTHGVRGRVSEFSGIPLLSFGPMPTDEVGAVAKRVVDIVLSAIGLVAFAPIYLAVVIAIKRLDPGPAIFAHERLGLRGKRFRLLKFRSMRVDAERFLKADPKLYDRYVANDFKLPEAEDPRISPLGRFLRKSSLDELPQLWNVLRGDMSLVGPRPIVPDEIHHYEPYAELFLAVRPGVTGRWQVSGRSDVRYPERAFMDLDYIGNNSLADDLAIILRTVPAVLARRGAH